MITDTQTGQKHNVNVRG